VVTYSAGSSTYTVGIRTGFAGEVVTGAPLVRDKVAARCLRYTRVLPGNTPRTESSWAPRATHGIQHRRSGPR
jgi:hypothetical protein